MNISLTELRQKLFQLADRVIETGEPLTITRKGVQLRLVRDECTPPPGGRFARLKRQNWVIGPPLDPHFSPAEWSGEPMLEVALGLPPADLEKSRRAMKSKGRLKRK